jgi:CRISPR-associated protein Cmx8
MSKEAKVEAVTLTFDLHELPTAQHRAGLAGLIFQIDAMGKQGYRRDAKLVPDVKVKATSATITFTRESMQGVFDELYAAKSVQVIVATKWPGETKPKPGDHFIEKKDPKTGELKKQPGFAYDVVQPQAPALKRHLEAGREAWLELWRQMLWAIPRGGNNVRSRAPFIDLANGRPCGEGATTWTQIVDFQKLLEQSQFKTAPISGALMLGAQAVNAEGVPFSGRVDHNLLLHFWQLVVLTFVPQVVNKKDAKVERVGYVLAIPDVADLEHFRHEFPEILQGLEAEASEYTPAKAKLDLPAQAALEVFRKLRGGAIKAVRVDRLSTFKALAADRAATEWGRSVGAVESYHMFKLGNNVKLLSFSRVANRVGLISEYERIAKHFRSPLFRAARFRALILDRPWHWGMVDLFAEYPHSYFLEGDDTPKYLPHFGRDARDLFNAYQQKIRDMKPEEMDQDEKLKHLGTIVRDLVISYVNRKAAKKLGLDWDDLPTEVVERKKRKVPPDAEKFREQQRRVCNDAFLQLRSRHDEDFVAFFADSICAVPHFFDNKAGDLPFLMQVLMTPPSRDPVAQPVRNRDDIKTLAMLALSAQSFNVRKRESKKEGSSS